MAERGGKVWAAVTQLHLHKEQAKGHVLLVALAQLFCQWEEASENVRLNLEGFVFLFMYRREGDSIEFFSFSAKKEESCDVLN